MSLCQNCVKGVRHEGTPEGKLEMIGGIPCYVGTPTGDYAKEKVILYAVDAFGIEFINNKLLVDDFARNGFKVIAPDYLHGDGVPIDAMETGFDIMTWLTRHPTEVIRPILDTVIASLKEQGVTTFGATGYCLGGRYVFDLAFENIIQVSVVAHPSLLKVPDDLEKYATQSKAPLLINSCTVDQMFPHEAQKVADEILGGGKFAPGYVREYYEGCTHGFAVRGDLNDPATKAGKERAFEKSVEFFLQHL
ncbi:dienelactone hydrolase [Leucogyrophana mollusca]|uniref:Dienelactone hydrolase n=1 Tax=Leucogyrophana mollusca TaxID=85980 RepID=A0ACB8BEY2_9AGAM|nr:dienelactone hydrolase [Leucogyrophana mollusca]